MGLLDREVNLQKIFSMLVSPPSMQIAGSKEIFSKLYFLKLANGGLGAKKGCEAGEVYALHAAVYSFWCRYT